MRGNRIQGSSQHVGLGSIPACAGEPSSGFYVAFRLGVYPRVCGGTPIIQPVLFRDAGLSPRVRGNRRSGGGGRGREGSIPACAGEPTYQMDITAAKAVYPRVCGGTVIRGGARLALWGLSPRVRGNQEVVVEALRVVGSIPACAGEPLSKGQLCRLVRVYPRVCGGTRRIVITVRHQPGLSPRVRGNRELRRCWLDVRGSIPACAGEPQPNAPTS